MSKQGSLRLVAGMVGGGQGADIGKTHRYAMRLDDRRETPHPRLGVGCGTRRDRRVLRRDSRRPALLFGVRDGPARGPDGA
ncbi:hypothetical protein [Rhodococcus opacus]|uniref:hypothetical protein n=1 Tax=Rhodococcus opacus TaxID=37919 RepID=UPI00358DFFA0